MTKNINIWVAVNKNGNVRMFTEEPTRNKNTNKWESDKPYINSVMQKEFNELVEKSNLTWEAEPNMFTLTLQK